MKIKGSITTKLFVITLSFYVVFILGMLVFQSAFFGKFYQNKKMQSLESATKELKKQYNANENNPYDDIGSIIKEFERKNNCKVAILNSYGNLKYFENDGEDDTAEINIIKDIMHTWVSNPADFLNMRRTGKSETYVFQSKTYNVKNIVCVVPGANNDVIFAISSFQSITEASSVMKEFFIYIFFSAVVVVIILALIYSRMITKPLKKINKTASKMAELDFSEKCNVISEDEIGYLGKNLNFLADNLNKSMNSLKAANEQLKKDIEKEKELEKMRKEFVAGVSHELKTPIGIIEGYAEGLKDNVAVTKKERDYYTDVIIDEAARMGKLVSDMLDLSQLESGNFKLTLGKFDIGEMVFKCSKKYYAILDEKKIDMSINIVNGYVMGDQYRLEQVFTNLLNNALKYAKRKIHVNMLKENNKITIEVVNDGEKIEVDEVCKIWDKFYKTDKSRNRKVGGTGLGLAIVKNIIELHNGSYGVLNVENGVKFYFSLKLC
ncbi:signal transduction histidine kinase [Clostridium acetobutylicum]|uniref:histidine kinase n=1 Tax=Clostridium acetobutylicum (strain ATCC 824 / DSM 792 / JCM 1419 / IAM 19013 / LMG 5710 / NBRC 13948 / NRRL B-527 / VKM B-1787 / 2291 / W) TaxID=272562 RepID=Q97GD4_CLOAB|nr:MULTISPECIES: HAMP domain-containing sensor histidine kinase [Clostridium]AAK80388.1 Membrane associatehistidine kinase with HAMP domain [Clostridium acetobutylicum ATCC 824]ADZ21485.1 Membrane associatehistidine kinase with HAMP domain [Clostridium acetobutylicum EA 2018]AEI34434.1 histidine kinase [Clostridium acetobutylicum DSM 1731]AWV79193.1 sensor histidine kinase [Clostridium acetobutylicum]MBC2394842.1 HAMP domain-containing histidine kinase [Clostridium acetobutylicum]